MRLTRIVSVLLLPALAAIWPAAAQADLALTFG